MRRRFGFFGVFVILLVVFLCKPVSAEDRELPVYDVDEISQLGSGYVSQFLGDYGDASDLTISLLDIFKYPTILGYKYFGYLSYEYVPVFRVNGVRIERSTLYALYQTSWYMKVWLFPHNLDKEYTVRSVYVIVMGQGLKQSAGLYGYDVSTIENVPKLIISSVGDVQSAPSVWLHISPQYVNELIENKPSSLELKNNYKKAYKQLLSDYKSAETIEEKRKILFTYHYYLKPAYYIIYTVYKPYVFIVIQVDNYTIKTRFYEYNGVVNIIIPVMSRNYILYYKMVKGLTIYNDFMALQRL